MISLRLNSSSGIPAGVSSRSKDASATFEWEKEIDKLVYKLYQLTYEEVKIIDPNIEKIISKADYDKFRLQ